MNPAESQPEDWIDLVRGNSGAPIFFFPGVAGDPSSFQGVAERVDGDRSSYAFRYPGSDGTGKPLSGVPEIAQRFLLQINALHPTGPVHLCGYSFGALIAFELACRLTQSDRAVGLLALLDAQVPGTRQQKPRLARLAIHARRLGSAEGRTELGRRLAGLLGRKPIIDAADELHLADPQGVSPTKRALFDASKRALQSWAPSAYSGRLTLLQAEAQPWMEFTIIDPTYGWDRLASQVKVRRVPGRHLQMFANENVGELAQALNQGLAEVAV